MTIQGFSKAATILMLIGALTWIGCGSDEEAETAPTPAPHRVLIEIDRMEGTSPVQIEQNIGGTRVSLVDIYSPAGIELRVVEDQTDLPRQESLRLADLHGLMMANNTVQPGPDEWKVHVLIVTADTEDPSTLGIMFDFADLDVNDLPREAFAIYETPHQTLPTGVAPEMLLTMAHELAHVFNLHHTDWDGKGFQDSSSVEGYSLTSSVLWRLSSRSVSHLTSHHLREMQPGSSGLAFGVVQQSHLDAHQPDPIESYEVADLNQLGASRGTGGPRSQSRLSRDRGTLPSTHALHLRLRSAKESYVLGEPVVLTVELHNEGASALDIIPLLEPAYGFLGLHLRGPGGTAYEPYHPPVLKEGRGGSRRALPAGEALYAEAKVFFGADGWTFTQPGDYFVLADFPSTQSPGSPRVASDSLRVRVVEPTTQAGRRALELLQIPDGTRLGAQQGLFLYLEGGDHLTVGKERLQRVVVEAPAAPQTSAARLALGHAALRPTINPGQAASMQRLEQARQYLTGLESQALPPLSVMRIHSELVEQLETQGRAGEAERMRRQVVRSMEVAPGIPQMSRPEIQDRIQ